MLALKTKVISNINTVIQHTRHIVPIHELLLYEILLQWMFEKICWDLDISLLTNFYRFLKLISVSAQCKIKQVLFYILFTVHHAMILGKWPTWHTNSFLCVYFFIYNSLHISSTRHSHQHGVTVTRGCIDTICLSWWWARCARNM